MRRFLIVNAGLALSGFYAGVASGAHAAPTAPPAPKVKVVAITGLSAVPTPKRCTFQKPCVGLQRGAAIHVELDSRGFAAVYLKDGPYFYLQEGRLAVQDDTIGDTHLWPGTSEAQPSGKVYPLYIVTSPTALQSFKDSTQLDRLPEGNRWGPAYLKTK